MAEMEYYAKNTVNGSLFDNNISQSEASWIQNTGAKSQNTSRTKHILITLTR